MTMYRKYAARPYFDAGQDRSTVVDACQPFKVRGSCGHIVIRKMREATAGVPYTPETILEAPNGRACEEREAHKCADCGKPIDVTKDKYWASTNLICDPCWQSYPVCEDLDEVSHV